MITQDNIYELLKHYLVAKGVMHPKEKLHSIWNHIHDAVFKEFSHFGLGIKPPILLPTSIEDISEHIRNDAMWLEGEGAELWTRIAGKASEAVVPSEEKEAEESDDGSSDEPVSTPKFKIDDKGDLSFAFRTGTNQIRPTTTEENLATELTGKTDALSEEIASGEKLTAETLAADKSNEKAVEDEIVLEETNTADQPEPTPMPTPEPTTAPVEEPKLTKAERKAARRADEAASSAASSAEDDDLNIEGA